VGTVVPELGIEVVHRVERIVLSPRRHGWCPLVADANSDDPAQCPWIGRMLIGTHREVARSARRDPHQIYDPVLDRFGIGMPEGPFERGTDLLLPRTHPPLATELR